MRIRFTAKSVESTRLSNKTTESTRFSKENIQETQTGSGLQATAVLPVVTVNIRRILSYLQAEVVTKLEPRFVQKRMLYNQQK